MGPYEVLAPIGAGGMGEVYRARDTRLGRFVALKISKTEFSERFEREARAVAALNHPNVCSLFDAGPNYLVMEYVEGAPVAPTRDFRKLLDVAIQMADGMAAAHAAEFVHRDLKPSNVLVSAEGRVKILDFGLAKSIAHTSDSDAMKTLPLTDPGMLAGTAAYMSPEQASRAANLDARSDQFSFGLMLYEMSTGQRAFHRSAAVETMAAIVREDPEPLPATVPAPLRWIIHRCLAKEPRDRYESSRDLYFELRSVCEHFADTSTSSATALPTPTSHPKKRFPWSISLGVFIAGVTLGAGTMLLMRSPPPPDGSALRFKPFSFEAGGQTRAVWSPDGRAVAFAARQKEADPMQLYVRSPDSPVAIQLTRMAEGAVPMAWMPTGRIVFHSARKPRGLWSVSPAGGEPEPFLTVEPQTGLAGDETATA